MKAMESTESMPGRGPIPAGGAENRGAALTADEFAARFQEAARVLWTVAAGVLGDASEAEDILQEACLIALGKLDRFRRDTNFTAWMGRFVRNVALNHARKRYRRATRPEEPDTLIGLPDGRFRGGGPVPGPNPRLPVDGRGELLDDQDAFDDRVLSGLQDLAPLQRAALLLRTVLELSYREISGTLEIPEGTAMSHVHRARMALRHALAAEPGREPAEATEMEEKPA